MRKMKRIALKVFYDGSYFNGFQRQPDGSGVENLLISALSKEGYLKDLREARWSYASRTDKGVSALGQVIAFNIGSDIHFSISRVNRHLLPKACIWALAEVHLNFHPRHHALSRHYKYIIPKSLLRGLEINRMKKATEILSGYHDYSNLVIPPPKSRSLINMKIEVEEKKHVIVVNFIAKSFYRKLIRSLVSLILYTAMGNISLDELTALIYGKFKLKQGIPPAPPEGLILWDIEYDKVHFIIDKSSSYSLLKYVAPIIKSLIMRGETLNYMKRGLEGLLLDDFNDSLRSSLSS